MSYRSKDAMMYFDDDPRESREAVTMELELGSVDIGSLPALEEE